MLQSLSQLLLLRFLLTFFVGFGTLVLVGELVIDAIIEVFIVEFFVSSVYFSYSDAEAKNDVFVFHEWRTDLNEPILFFYIGLP